MVNAQLVQRAARRYRRHRRPDSRPLMSGDSFARLADFIPFGRPFRRGRLADSRIWFVELSDLEGGFGREALIETASRATSAPVLVLHNGDLLPPSDFFADAVSHFRAVFTVNLVEETTGLKALPIGLENAWLRGSKRILQMSRNVAALHGLAARVETRRVPISANFRPSTNPAARKDLVGQLAKVGIPSEPLQWKDYCGLLSRSLLVISPPGNGPDCHRTWEAIYHGAVPVVLRSSIARSVSEGQRMLVVDSWHEVLDLSLDEIKETYVALASRPIDRALMPFWQEQIVAATGD